MLVQIIADKDGVYYYSSEAAKEIIKIWQKIKIDKKGHIISDINKIDGTAGLYQ